MADLKVVQPVTKIQQEIIEPDGGLAEEIRRGHAMVEAGTDEVAQGWERMGRALIAGRERFPSKREYGQWIKREKIDQLPLMTPTTRSDLIWWIEQIDANSNLLPVVDKEIIHPQKIRQAVRKIEKKAKKKEKLDAELDAESVIPDATRWGVRHGDVANLSMIEDNTVDVIITDPPYPKKYLPLFSALSKEAARVLKPGGSCFVMSGQVWLPEVFQRLTEHLNYRWTMAYLTPGGQSPNLPHVQVNTFWKPVIVLVKGKPENGWMGDVVKSNTNNNDKRFHHWGQSVSGMVSLVEQASKPDEVILDPFCGGGTTGVAALLKGRKFLGVDNDAEQATQAKERLTNLCQAMRELDGDAQT